MWAILGGNFATQLSPTNIQWTFGMSIEFYIIYVIYKNKNIIP